MCIEIKTLKNSEHSQGFKMSLRENNFSVEDFYNLKDKVFDCDMYVPNWKCNKLSLEGDVGTVRGVEFEGFQGCHYYYWL